jgi:DNA-binding beta-propeller fold protein YncE
MRLFRVLSPIVAMLCCAPALTAQLRQVAILDIPGRPGFDEVAFAGGKLVMTHAGANAVDIFDPVRRRLYARVNNMSQPRGIAVDEQGGRVFIANAGNNSITVLSTQDWQVKSNFKLTSSPDELLFVPETHLLYASNWHDGSISMIDPQEGKERTETVGDLPEGMVFDPQMKRLLVSLEAQGIIAVLTPDLKPVAQFQLRGSQPTALALDVKGRRLFCSVRYAVLALDADSGAEVGRVTTGAGADKLWFDDASRTLYAASGGGSVTTIALDGNRYVSEQELVTDVHGHALAVDAAHGLVYVPGGREGRSKLVILKRMSATRPRTESASAAIRR